MCEWKNLWCLRITRRTKWENRKVEWWKKDYGHLVQNFTKTNDPWGNWTPNLEIWSLTRYLLRQGVLFVRFHFYSIKVSSSSILQSRCLYFPPISIYPSPFYHFPTFNITYTFFYLCTLFIKLSSIQSVFHWTISFIPWLGKRTRLDIQKNNYIYSLPETWVFLF